MSHAPNKAHVGSDRIPSQIETRMPSRAQMETLANFKREQNAWFAERRAKVRDLRSVGWDFRDPKQCSEAGCEKVAIFKVKDGKTKRYRGFCRGHKPERSVAA